MKKRLAIAAAVLAVLLVGGIVGATVLTWDIDGTMVYEDLEGGAWFVQAKNGELFLPLNLTEDLQIEGLRVKFRVVEKPDTITIIMRGKPVEIVKVLD